MDFEELAYYLYMDSQEKKRAAREQQPHRYINNSNGIERYRNELENNIDWSEEDE